MNFSTLSETHSSSRQQLLDALHQGPVIVTFLKTDGTERDMTCTLQEGVAIPHVKTTERVKEKNDDVCPVWDMDKNAWRSFRYDSIVEIEIVTGVEDEGSKHI